MGRPSYGQEEIDMAADDALT